MEGLRTRDRMPSAEELDRLIEERTKVKQQEVREACAIMGCTDVRFLIYTDSVLIVNEEIIEAIARLVREVRPHIVITHHPKDNGGIADQHSVTGQLVLDVNTNGMGFGSKPASVAAWMCLDNNGFRKPLVVSIGLQ